MKKILGILMLMLAVALTACGGGGGSAGANPNQAALLTTAGSEVILPTGAARNYQINGGVPPYRISNSDQSVAIGQISGSTLTIGAVSAGSANINVIDFSGASVAIRVNVGSSVPLYTTAPSTLTIGVGVNVARTFFIGGGGAPYTVEGSDSNVALVQVLSGTQWKITGVARGSTTVNIRDAAGAEVAVAVTVGAPELTISPTDLTIPVGLEATAKITGGQPPYRVAGGIPAAITAVVQGDELILKGSLASEMDVSVIDAAGQTVKIKVTINTTTTSIRLSPSVVSLSENDSQPVQFTIFGATGATCVFTSDPSFLQPTVAGCANRSTITLETGTRGSRCVTGNTPVLLTVVDANRSVGTAQITIIDNGTCGNLSVTPSIAQVQTGATTQLVLTGGSGRYVVSSDNPRVATATASGVIVVITGGSVAGNAVITIRDESDVSKVVTLPVTVTASSTPALATSPQTLTVPLGASSDVLLSGGSGNYDFAVSNTAVATAALNGSKLTITAGATSGTTTVTVRDQADPSRSVVVSVTVTAGTAPVRPLTSSPLAASGFVQETLLFALQNGTAPFKVQVSSPAVATAAVVGTNVEVLLRAAGSTTLVVTDANNQTLNIAVTSSQGQAASLRFAPSAFEIGEDSETPVTLTVFGGTPPYRAITSDFTLSNVAVSNNEFTIGLGTRGSRCINPVDSSGVYIPRGAFDVLLTVVDSGGAFATSTMTIRDNGTGIPGTCPQPLALSTTAGAAASILLGNSRTFSIRGGVPPYTVASNNPAVASAVLSSQAGLSITGLTTGAATVTIRDAASATSTISVMVNP